MCLSQKVQVRGRIWFSVTGYILEMDSNLIEYFTLDQRTLKYF